MVILFVVIIIVDGMEVGLLDFQIVVNLRRKQQDQVRFCNLEQLF